MPKLAPDQLLSRKLLFAWILRVAQRPQFATDDESFLTVDGQLHVTLQDGDTVNLITSPDPCLFARVQDKAYFSATLVNRLRRTE